jgi:hypothetical protein
MKVARRFTWIIHEVRDNDGKTIHQRRGAA